MQLQTVFAAFIIADKESDVNEIVKNVLMPKPLLKRQQLAS